MARSGQTIQNQITAFYVAAMAAVGVTIDTTKWSRRNKQQVALNTFATGTATLEQNFDAFTSDIEAIIGAGAPDTAPWIQSLCLNQFQYDATTPQIPQLDIAGLPDAKGVIQPPTFAPYFPVPDNTKKIITQCVVVPGIFGTTIVKAAKAAGILAGPELSALQSYLNLINIPGININASSGNADKIYLNAILTYYGGYYAVIQSTVPAAIQSYLASIPTSGIVTDVNSPTGLMKLTSLIAAVKAVPGVVDFELVNVNARPDGTSLPVSGPYNLVNGADWINTAWQSGLIGAGYMILENTGPVGTDGVTNITYNSI